MLYIKLSPVYEPFPPTGDPGKEQERPARIGRHGQWIPGNRSKLPLPRHLQDVCPSSLPRHPRPQGAPSPRTCQKDHHPLT